MTTTPIDQGRRQKLESMRGEANPGTRPPKRGWLGSTLGAAVACLVVAVAGYAIGRHTDPLADHVSQQSAVAQNGRTKAAALMIPTGQGAVLEASGFVTARRQSAVSAPITAQLAQLLVEEGDRVQKGQLIARLASDDYRASLNALNASVGADRAKAAQDRYASELAAKTLARYKLLVKTNIIPASQYDTLLASANEDTAALRADEMTARADQARADEARVQLGYTEVRAPFSGVVISQDAQVGDIISPQGSSGSSTRTSVVTIVDMDSLEVDADINESFIGRVKVGSKAVVRLDAYPDWAIPTSVLAVIPSADRSRATIRVRLALQKDPRIVPNMAARISFDR